MQGSKRFFTYTPNDVTLGPKHPTQSPNHPIRVFNARLTLVASLQRRALLAPLPTRARARPRKLSQDAHEPRAAQP